jgi:hypothetical protein
MYECNWETDKQLRSERNVIRRKQSILKCILFYSGSSKTPWGIVTNAIQTWEIKTSRQRYFSELCNISNSAYANLHINHIIKSSAFRDTNSARQGKWVFVSSALLISHPASQQSRRVKLSSRRRHTESVCTSKKEGVSLYTCQSMKLVTAIPRKDFWWNQNYWISWCQMSCRFKGCFKFVWTMKD